MWRDASFMWAIWLIQVCQSFFISPLTYLLLFNLSATYLLSWHNISHSVIYKSVYWCEKYQEDETHVSDGKQYTLWYIKCPLFSILLSNFLPQKRTFFLCCPTNCLQRQFSAATFSVDHTLSCPEHAELDENVIRWGSLSIWD